MTKRVIITGATGNLGSRLVKKLADATDYSVVAVGSSMERLMAMLERIEHRDKVILLTIHEMLESDISNCDIHGAIHFAFSRSNRSSDQIASSLDYSLAAFRKVVNSEIPNGVYVSSQSVYGSREDFPTEETAPGPGSIYAMAKYAGEKLFESSYTGHEKLQHTILRLDLVIQSQNLVTALCRNAIENGELTLKGGGQMYSYIDEDDVAEAILALFNTDTVWKSVYNVGPNKSRHSLVQVADAVKKVVEEGEDREVKVTLMEDKTAFWSGMDTSRFMKDTGWMPQYELDEMVQKIYLNVKRSIANRS